MGTVLYHVAEAAKLFEYTAKQGTEAMRAHNMLNAAAKHAQSLLVEFGLSAVGTTHVRSASAPARRFWRVQVERIGRSS